MADETTGGANAGGANTGGTGTGSEAGAGAPQGSDNPDLTDANKAAEANPPAVTDERRIVMPIDEVQKEVGENGVVFEKRSQASAGQLTEDGITGAPDGFGVGVDGGQGQTAPVDTTEEAEEEAEKAAKKSRAKK